MSDDLFSVTVFIYPFHRDRLKHLQVFGRFGVNAIGIRYFSIEVGTASSLR